MKDKIKLFGLIALVAIIGFSMTACPTDGGGGEGGGGGNNTDPKTLVVTMSATIFGYGSSNFMVGLFPVGTTVPEALERTNLVAGAENNTDGVSYSGTDPVILTLPLYKPINGNDYILWTGSGTYYIYAVVGTHYYKKSSVNISSAITNIKVTDSDEITQNFEGTWYATTAHVLGVFRIHANGGSWTQSFASSRTATTWTNVIEGTYTGNSATINRVNLQMFDGANEWKTWEELDPTIQGHMGGQKERTITISNFQFTNTGFTFEKY